MRIYNRNIFIVLWKRKFQGKIPKTMEKLNMEQRGYLEVKLEHNLPIPVPEKVSDYSGKFVVRLPKSLHQRLAIEAEQEGVSLNQLALYKLAR